MIAEIVSTGDEVLTGAVADSNAAFIAARLYEIGIPVGRHVCVGDDLERLTAVLRESADRADVAVVTGGLGPTVDDITAMGAARAAGEKLQPNSTARAYIEEFFKRFGRRLSDSDAKQSEMPVSARPILNPVGTAPGFTMTMGGCRFYFLPGVPFEMRRMMGDSVIVELQAQCADDKTRGFYREKRLSLFGLPEAHVNERLADLTESPGDVKLGMLAEFPVIHVKLAAQGRDPEGMEARIEKAAAEVRQRVGAYVFSDSGQTMEEVVGALLTEHCATLALAESCTGGLIAHRVTNVAGSSDYFVFSAVTYANAAKINLLGVSPDTIEAHGAVSEETAREMAEGVRRVAGADYGLSVSGIAGPGGGSPEKPVGMVCIGLCGPGHSFSRHYKFPFENRMANKRIFAETALDRLRRTLIGAGDIQDKRQGET